MKSIPPNAASKSVVFITLSYAPSVGGAERQVQALAEAWARRGQRICVLTRQLPGVPSSSEDRGVHVERLWCLWIPVLSWVTFSCMAFLYLFRHRREVGCLIVQMLNVAALPATLFARLLKCSLIIKPSAGGTGGNLYHLLRSPLGRLKKTVFLGACDYLAAINQEVADELKSVGVPSGKIRHIPNGVDTDLYKLASRETRAQARRSLNLSEDDLVVLFVGRLEKVKNVEILPPLMQGVWTKVHSAKLLIIGDGTEAAGLKRAFSEHIAAGRVMFQGNQADVRPFYAAADVFLLPSLREGISNSLLEALACGIPAVVSRVGGNPDIVGPISQELLVNPLDLHGWVQVLGALLSDAEKRRKLGPMGRQVVLDRFGLVATVNAYEQLYAASRRPFFRHAYPILAYHRVLPEVRYAIDVSTAVFERHMAWLSRQGYRTLTLREFYRCWEKGEPYPAKTVVITFDDGHREVYEHAAPILMKYGFRATLFLCPGRMGRRWWIGGRRPAPVHWHAEEPADYRENSSEWRSYELMSWEQVRTLAEQGFEVGSHTETHPFLTQLGDEELERELVRSKAILEEQLGVRIDFLCYPSEDFNPRVERMAEATGYRGAVYTPDHGELAYRWDNPFAFERIGIWYDMTDWKFRGLVLGWYRALVRYIPSVFWRAGRVLRRCLRKPV